MLNQHNSTSVASQKTKLIDGGINAITSGGKGMYAGRATSKELGKLIDAFETSGRFHKNEIDGIRKVFSKELSKRDPSSGSWSLFGTPKGISKARLEKNTFGSRSVENQIYSALRGHDKTTQQKLAKQLFPILEATAEGGQGIEHGRITRQEADSALAFTESISGYTTRDRSAIKNILYRALGEKSTATPTLHPLSTGNVTHKKTAGLGVVPPPADGVEKNTPAKTPVMHAPHMVLGAFIPNAATAPSWKDRATETATDVEQSSHTDSSTQKEESAVEDTPMHVNDVEDIKTATQPLSSRNSFKERLARRRAERSAFTQYEQSTTQLTRASHESLTEKPAPVGKSGTTTFEDRLKKREDQRRQLNETKQPKGGVEHATGGMRMPSFNSHVMADFSKPKQPEGIIKESDVSIHAYAEGKIVSKAKVALEQNVKNNPADTRETEEGLPNNYQEKLAELRVLGPRILGNSLMTEFEIMARGGDADGVRDEFYPDWKDEDFRRLITDLKKGVSQSPSVSSGLSQEDGIVKNNDESIGAPQENPSDIPTVKGGGVVPTENLQDTHDDESHTVHNPSMKLRAPHITVTDTESVLRESGDQEQSPDGIEGIVVDLQTNLGAIAIELYGNDVPATAEQFLRHAKSGVYNGLKFHRVVKDYVIQAGEVSGGTVEGNTASDEKPEHPYSNMRGTVSMVSADKNAGGGTFSINVVNNVVLDGRYVVFGTVIAGMDVVDAISQVPTDSNEAPKTPVVIESVSIS